MQNGETVGRVTIGRGVPGGREGGMEIGIEYEGRPGARRDVGRRTSGETTIVR